VQIAEPDRRMREREFREPEPKTEMLLRG